MWERTKVLDLAHSKESNERDVYSNLRLPYCLLSYSQCFWRPFNYFQRKTPAFWNTGVLLQGHIFSDSSLLCFSLSLWSLKVSVLQKCHWEGKARELCLSAWNKADLQPSLCCLPSFHAAASHTPMTLWSSTQVGWRGVNLYHQSYSLWGTAAFWYLPAAGLVRSTDSSQDVLFSSGFSGVWSEARWNGWETSQWLEKLWIGSLEKPFKSDSLGKPFRSEFLCRFVRILGPALLVSSVWKITV